MTRLSEDDILHRFRRELVQNDLLHDGDSIGTDDETLLRFLRARKFDLLRSQKMFADCQRWRQTTGGVGIDQLYQETDPFDYPEREAVFDCWPMWFHKTRYISSMSSSKMDLAKLYKVCTPERHWKIVLVNAECLPREVLPAASRVAGRTISDSLVIADLKGFGLTQFWQVKALARSSFQISQDYYPETMGQLIIINVPSSFAVIWNVIKPWLSKETVGKIDILGSDYKQALLELVDADSLPTSLGGECTCEGLGGCELSGAGPWLTGRKWWGPRSQASQVEEETVTVTDGAPSISSLSL